MWGSEEYSSSVILQSSNVSMHCSSYILGGLGLDLGDKLNFDIGYRVMCLVLMFEPSLVGGVCFVV